MSNVQVKNVDPELHEQLPARAAAAGVPLGEYVLELIRRDLRTPSRHEWLAQVRSMPRIGRDEDIAPALCRSPSRTMIAVDASTIIQLLTNARRRLASKQRSAVGRPGASGTVSR